MQYYDNRLFQNLTNLVNYFKTGIVDNEKNISHCLLFWGPDINVQCSLALEISRLLNCSENKEENCNCLNCRWVKEQSHPAVKIFTRLDYKDNSVAENSEGNTTKGKKNITVEQAKAIISELAITSDYHRVYIFCDRDEDGNLLPLNQINFPEATSNALLKTFEEPPSNTTFIFLTKDPTDVISTVVSRSQVFFVPKVKEVDENYSSVEHVINNYWLFDKNSVLEFENNILGLMSELEPIAVLSQIQNYMLSNLKSNFDNKKMFYRLLYDIQQVEVAKRQISLTPSMNLQAVVETLCFKILL